MWSYSPQNRYFLVTICSKGVCPLNGFLPNLAWKGSPRVAPYAKFFRCGFKNMGLEPTKSQKLVIFGIYLTKRVYPLKQFKKKLSWEGLPGPHGCANFHYCGFKNVALRPPKSPKIAIFGIKLPQEKIQGSIEKLEYRCTTRNIPLCNGSPWDFTP